MPDGDIRLPNLTCDSFVLGSDYSLNLTAARTRNHIEYFLMAFAEDGKRKIAYAPSLGTPNVDDPNTKMLYQSLLKRFTFLSFREDSAVEFCKKHFQLDSQYVLDPVFLVEEKIFREFSSQSKLQFEKPYICSYILDPTVEKIRFVESKAEELGVDYWIILDRPRRTAKYPFIKEENLIKNPSFEDFISCFINCNYIITDSFHGTCFAVLFNKQFVSFKNRNRNRFDAIQNLLNNEHNICKSIFDTVNAANQECDFLHGCDYTEINKIVEKNRLNCLGLLGDALSADVIQNDGISVDMYVQYARLWRKAYTFENRIKIIDANTKKFSKIIAKTSDNLPDYLKWTMDFSHNHMKLLFSNVNRKIHYELYWPNKLYFCLHCEDKSLEKNCIEEFLQVKKIWNIETNNPMILNKEISIQNADTEILDLLTHSLKYTSKFMHKKGLSTLAAQNESSDTDLEDRQRVAEFEKWVIKAKEQGNHHAQYRVGETYRLGSGVKKDDVEAVKWYKKSAEQNNQHAQYRVGDAFMRGVGVPKDLAESVKWFRKSAEQGNQHAQYRMGAAYLNGVGVGKDKAEALRWFRKSAGQGNKAAEKALKDHFDGSMFKKLFRIIDI